MTSSSPAQQTTSNKKQTSTIHCHEENGIVYQCDVHPRVQRFKATRQRNQKLAAVTGGVVGGALLTPLGLTPVGIAVGGWVCHRVTKTTGRALQARMERQLEAHGQEERQERQEALTHQDATTLSQAVVLGQ